MTTTVGKQIVITIDNKIRIPLEDVSRRIERILREEFTHQNPKHHKLARMNRMWASKEPAEISLFEVSDSEICLPRGGLNRVARIFADEKVAVSWSDNRTLGDPSAAGKCPEHFPAGKAGLTPSGGDVSPGLWEHQARMMVACVSKQQGVARAPTGSGKTTAAISMCEAIQLPTIVVVYDNGLRKQWAARLVKELGLMPTDIGVIGAGKFSLKPITIAMQQTLAKMSPDKWLLVNSYFGAVICDECQRFAAKTFVQVIDKFTAKYRIGISADESRRDEKEFLIYDMFGERLVDIPLAELVEKKLVHDVDVRVHPTEFEADWYVKARSNTSNRNPFAKEDSPDFNRLLAEMAADPGRNAIAVELAVSECRAGNQTVLFSHRRGHCVELNGLIAAEGFPSGLMLGGVADAVEFDNTIDRLKRKKIMCAAGTVQAVGQGLDIPTVSRGVACTPMTSNRQMWGQLRGRMCRIADGKKDAVVHVLWDRKIYGIPALKNLVRWNNRVSVCTASGYVTADEYIESNKRETTNAKTFDDRERRRIDRIFKTVR